MVHDRSNAVGALIVQTNNATYDGLGESEQQLQYARLRALENNFQVLVVSTNGISAAISPAGIVNKTLHQDQTGVILVDVKPNTAPTLANRGHGLLLATIFGLSALVLLRRRNELSKV